MTTLARTACGSRFIVAGTALVGRRACSAAASARGAGSGKEAAATGARRGTIVATAPPSEANSLPQPATAASSGGAPSSPLRCRTASEVGELVRRVYGDDMWALLQPPPASGASAAASAAVTASAGRAAVPVNSSVTSSVRTPGALLHVTSLFRPRPAHRSNDAEAAGGLGDDDGVYASDSGTLPLSERLFTLQVTGPDALRHPLDRFALCLSRALAAEVVYSGRVMREEPDLRCTFDEAFDAGLRELRQLHDLPPLPAISVLTRAASPAEIDSNSSIGLPFAHPLIDFADAASQPITVWHSQPALGETILRRLRSLGLPVPSSSITGRDVLELELSTLLRASSASDDAESVPYRCSNDPPSAAHPLKLIRLVCTHGARARAVFESIAARISDSGDQQNNAAFQRSSFMAHLSIEAGPQVTRELYSDGSRSTGGESLVAAPSPGERPPPVQTLLLTVYRGVIAPEHFRRFLVYPPAASVAASGPSALNSSSAEDIAAPPASLTLPYLRRWYHVRSEYRCPHEPDWSFVWLERKAD